MQTGALVIIEVILVFGAVLAFGFWELRKLRKAREAREAHKRSAEEDSHNDAS